jgi:hypothetical protein
MTRVGNIIFVERDEAIRLYDELLKEVEAFGRRVSITHEGKVIALMGPPQSVISPLAQHSELTGVKFNSDPTAPLDDEDWPEDLR